jgi:hypothetical protein
MRQYIQRSPGNRPFLHDNILASDGFRFPDCCNCSCVEINRLNFLSLALINASIELCSVRTNQEAVYAGGQSFCEGK